MRRWPDPGPRRTALLALVAQTAAVAPAWRWYGERLLDSANEPWGLLALAAACAAPSRTADVSDDRAGLTVPTLLLLLYTATLTHVPALLSTTLALAAAGCTWSLWRHATPWFGARWALVLLSVPMLTSVHFYLGYPLRMVSAAGSALMLQLAGFNVVREGVCLGYGGRLVLVDAPCSGVRMIWAAMFLVLALAARHRLSAARTVAAAAGAVALSVFGNTLRTTALFFPETGLVRAPSGLHAGLGVVVFLIVATLLAATVRRPREAPCAA